MDLICTWTANNDCAIAEDSIEEWYQSVIDSLLKEKDVNLFVATEMMLMRLRIGVREGDLSSLRLFFNNQFYDIDKEGKIVDWPHNLGVLDNYLTRLIL